MILRSLSAPDAEKFYTLMCTAAGRELPREAFAQALAQALEQTGRRVPCDTAAFLCRAPMVSPFFHTRMIVLSHPWPILKATSGKKEDVDL